MFLSGTGDVAGNLRFGEVPTDVRLVWLISQIKFRMSEMLASVAKQQLTLTLLYTLRRESKKLYH